MNAICFIKSGAQNLPIKSALSKSSFFSKKAMNLVSRIKSQANPLLVKGTSPGTSSFASNKMYVTFVKNPATPLLPKGAFPKASPAPFTDAAFSPNQTSDISDRPDVQKSFSTFTQASFEAAKEGLALVHTSSFDSDKTYVPPVKVHTNPLLLPTEDLSNKSLGSSFEEEEGNGSTFTRAITKDFAHRYFEDVSTFTQSPSEVTDEGQTPFVHASSTEPTCSNNPTNVKECVVAFIPLPTEDLSNESLDSSFEETKEETDFEAAKEGLKTPLDKEEDSLYKTSSEGTKEGLACENLVEYMDETDEVAPHSPSDATKDPSKVRKQDAKRGVNSLKDRVIACDSFEWCMAILDKVAGIFKNAMHALYDWGISLVKTALTKIDPFLKLCWDILKWCWDTAKKFVNDLRDAIHTLSCVVNPNYKEINENLEKLEKCLNYWGKIPGISILSGASRGTLGLAEMTGGLAYSLFHSILFPITIALNKKNKEMACERVKMDLAYCIHGAANISRAGIEISMINSLFIVCNLFIGRIVYDMLEFRLKYPTVPDCLLKSNLETASSLPASGDLCLA